MVSNFRQLKFEFIFKFQTKTQFKSSLSNLNLPFYLKQKTVFCLLKKKLNFEFLPEFKLFQKT
jgi:hypothetical protein